jgi:SMI1 / KNR4 family (SUKH-1)
VLWDSRWVPFSAFGGSPRLILDLRPGQNGTHGQVWQDWPGRDREDDRTVIAPTFAEFSTELLRWLTTGSVLVEREPLVQPVAGGPSHVVAQLVGSVDHRLQVLDRHGNRTAPHDACRSGARRAARARSTSARVRPGAPEKTWQIATLIGALPRRFAPRTLECAGNQEVAAQKAPHTRN